MDDITLEQRIRYLIEHGGVWDDPLADLRRKVWGLYAIGGLFLVLHVVELLI